MAARTKGKRATLRKKTKRAAAKVGARTKGSTSKRAGRPKAARKIGGKGSKKARPARSKKRAAIGGRVRTARGAKDMAKPRRSRTGISKQKRGTVSRGPPAAARGRVRTSTRRAPPRVRRRAPRGALGFVETAARTVKRGARRIARAILPASRGPAPETRARRTSAPRQARSMAPRGVVIRGALGPRYDEILTREALTFIAELHRRFDDRRKRLLATRAEQQTRYDAGAVPDFLPETRDIRNDEWKVAPIPHELLDRRVEITGPVDRKMVINALNSGANVYMADFEDANSPTWANNLEGQINLKDRWNGTLAFTDPATGRDYRLDDKTAVMIVRPRGWHLVEEHLTVDGTPVSAALFDFGLAFFHNALAQVAQGTGPYFYLPKLETHREARLWNEVFVFAQEELGIPAGTIKATVLIETLPAAFEMDEILWELRDHIVGLNAGRWDFIFSFIKKLKSHPECVLPDRSRVVMGEAFLGGYAALLVVTCHRRGAFAMGGMAAQIPVKNDPAANEAAFAKVRADKEREVRDGYDGTWVAHPDLVPVAKEVFDRMMPQPNQLDRMRLHVRVLPEELLVIHEGTKTDAGFRLNIRVGVQYIEAWLRGRGAVPIYNLMEDAATAEISRAQIWQWIKYGVELDTGVKATPEFFKRALAEEMEMVKSEIGIEVYDEGRFPEAIELFSDLSLSDHFEDFLTIPAYRLIA